MRNATTVRQALPIILLCGGPACTPGWKCYLVWHRHPWPIPQAFACKTQAFVHPGWVFARLKESWLPPHHRGVAMLVRIYFLHMHIHGLPLWGEAEPRLVCDGNSGRGEAQRQRTIRVICSRNQSTLLQTAKGLGNCHAGGLVAGAESGFGELRTARRSLFPHLEASTVLGRKAPAYSEHFVRIE